MKNKNKHINLRLWTVTTLLSIVKISELYSVLRDAKCNYDFFYEWWDVVVTFYRLEQLLKHSDATIFIINFTYYFLEFRVSTWTWIGQNFHLDKVYFQQHFRNTNIYHLEHLFINKNLEMIQCEMKIFFQIQNIIKNDKVKIPLGKNNIE